MLVDVAATFHDVGVCHGTQRKAVDTASNNLRMPRKDVLNPSDMQNIWREGLVFAFLPRSLRPPLWSSGQSFWLQIQKSRVRFPALPDFLSSSGSGTGSTQPREIN